MQFLDIEKVEVKIEENKDFLWSNINNRHNPIHMRHYQKSYLRTSGIFNIPPNINHFRVISRKVKKFAPGDSKLMFICPPPTSNCDQMPSILVPVFRLLLSGLIILDTLHIWPGEFLPNRLPSIPPLPLPTINCNVIEPQWSDNSL